MAVLWLLLELFMTFLYYDLPTVKNDVDDHSTNDERHRYDNSVQNYSSTERNIANNSINVDATENEHIVSGDMIRDLYSKHSSIIDSRRQNLINTTTQDFQRRARNEPVMDKWHLAKGMHR